jgi:outer membrane receptor protein involved in Fe transport
VVFSNIARSLDLAFAGFEDRAPIGRGRAAFLALPVSLSKGDFEMKRILWVGLLACILAISAFGQAGIGGISGAVRDASGASVPGATVTISNEAKGIRRVLESNNAGVFNAPALIPASGYTVTVEKTGFAKFEVRDVTIQVGQTVDFNVALAVASAATQVDVSATAPVIEDTKTDVSTLINQRQILDLPVNGRRVDSFALTGTAVVPDGAFGLLSFRGVAGHNSFLTDGNDTTNSFYNENAGRTRIQSQISQEAVQEFQVISDNFAAEYGQAMGGVINTITKSGTNDIHGTGYWFFRNRTLNARDRYATLNPQDIRHQSGFSLGGALKKDKLFYYINYEATRRNFPAIASITNANGNLFTAAGTLNGTLNPCPDPNATVKATAAQCSAAINMVTTRNFGTVSRTVVQDLGFAKLDYHLNEKNTLSASLSMLRWVSPHGIQATGIVFNTGNAIGNNADSTVRNAYGKMTLTSILSARMVNEARFGWFKDRLYDPASPDFLYPGLGLAGLTVNSTGNLGVATSYPRLNPSERRFEYADNLSVISGAHTLKFGIDFATTEDYVNNLATQFGSYTYSSLNNYALDFSGNSAGLKSYNSYSQSFGNPIVDPTVKTTGLYGQDQWRVSPNLLVNIGLRYDYTSIPQPKISNPDYPQTARINTTKDNIQPRAGISYTVGKDRKTLLRAGYGIFYARYQTGLIENLFLTNGVYQKSITYSTAAQIAVGPVYPNYLASTNFNPPAGSLNLLFGDKNLRNPYTHQANIGIEREITSTIQASISYVWSRGVRLYGVRDLNVNAPTDSITYTILNPAGTIAGTFTNPVYRTRPDTRYRQISQIENPGLSYYDGLALQLTKRFAKGFQAGAAYTWSHAIDLNQSTATNNIFFSSTPTSYANEFASERGSAANDVRHRLVVNFVYSPTFTKSNSFWARYFVNNWQLSSVTVVQSAQPVNSTTAISGSAFTGALVTGSLNGLGGDFSRVPFQPVSNLDVDRIYHVDARLTKKLPFSERVTGYLIIEAFNLFNTPYDTSRNNTEYTFNNCTASSSAANCPAGATGPTLTYRSSYGAPTSDALSPDGTTARRAQVSLRVTF